MSVEAAWAFASSSGATVYETVLTEEGELKCNCPGYVFKRKDEERRCRHTRLLEPYRARVLDRSLTPEGVGVRVGAEETSHNTASPSASLRQVAIQSKETLSEPPPSPHRERRFDFRE